MASVEQAAFSAASPDGVRRCLRYVRSGQLPLAGADDAELQSSKARRMVAQTPLPPRLDALARMAFLQGLVRR